MTDEEKHLHLCQLVSRGVPMAEARKRLSMVTPAAGGAETVATPKTAPAVLPTLDTPVVPAVEDSAVEDLIGASGAEEEPDGAAPAETPPVATVVKTQVKAKAVKGTKK